MLSGGGHAHIHLLTVIPIPSGFKTGLTRLDCFAWCLRQGNISGWDLAAPGLTFVPKTQGDMMCRHRTTPGKDPVRPWRPLGRDGAAVIVSSCL